MTRLTDVEKGIGAVLAVLMPPAAVIVARKGVGHFLLNVGLTFFLWAPGVLHGLWCVFASGEDI
jgi:uncharacterized membrane protein YqaE (UPF0057 family)